MFIGLKSAGGAGLMVPVLHAEFEKTGRVEVEVMVDQDRHEP